MTTFNGIKDYRASDPDRLREDLRRQNVSLEQMFATVERERAARPVPRRVTKDTAAAHDEALLVDASAGVVKVFLPSSSPDKACRFVRVCSVKNVNSILVVAANGNTVMGGAANTLPVSFGYRDYMDDGQGGWWSE